MEKVIAVRLSILCTQDLRSNKLENVGEFLILNDNVSFNWNSLK